MNVDPGQMSPDPDTQRAEMLERWDRAAVGWGRRADDVRDYGMPVSMWMIEHAGLHPGSQVLELAAGPGDTGFLAAELIEPGGRLITSDASEGMLEVARARAERLGISNVEFKRLELEWIDLPTASVDAVLCRWGVMLSVDPAAALQETRRVLRPGGHVAVAVWDDPKLNPWATIPPSVLIEQGLMERPAPGGPDMFALAAPGVLRERLEEAGFVDVTVAPVQIERQYTSVDQYIEETTDLSVRFAENWQEVSSGERAAIRSAIEVRLAPYVEAPGRWRLPGVSLAAVAS